MNENPFHRRGRCPAITLPVLDETTTMREMNLVMVRPTVDENDEGDGEKFEVIVRGWTKGQRKVVAAS